MLLLDFQPSLIVFRFIFGTWSKNKNKKHKRTGNHTRPNTPTGHASVTAHNSPPCNFNPKRFNWRLAKARKDIWTWNHNEQNVTCDKEKSWSTKFWQGIFVPERAKSWIWHSQNYSTDQSYNLNYKVSKQIGGMKSRNNKRDCQCHKINPTTSTHISPLSFMNIFTYDRLHFNHGIIKTKEIIKMMMILVVVRIWLTYWWINRTFGFKDSLNETISFQRYARHTEQ